MNDDILAKFIFADDTADYQRLFKKYHTTPYCFSLSGLLRLATWRRVFFTFFPLILCAFHRYIVIRPNPSGVESLPEELTGLNYMFYPHEEEKLFITSFDKVQSGHGTLFKVTTNVDYEPVMEKEFVTASRVSQLCRHAGLVPEVIGRITCNGRSFYQEKFVAAKTLAMTLKNPEVHGNPLVVCGLIDQLDNWYRAYRSQYCGGKEPFNDLYAPIFDAFFHYYAADSELCLLAEKIQASLAEVSRAHPGLIPIIAHNDLWPPNILVTEQGVVVIDWERATADRAELFDYFWMMISTALACLSHPQSFDDFSQWFRIFLTSTDPVCCHARKKLHCHLNLNGISVEFFNLFLALFLMELSIHVRHTQTGQLATEEFKYFARSHF